MAKQPGPPGSPSPRKRRDREQRQQQSQSPQQILTPSKAGGSAAQQGSPSKSKRTAVTTPPSLSKRRAASPSSAAAHTTANVDGPTTSSTATIQAWQRCSSLLREAVVDSGCDAAALVPLRPSLRRIKDDLVRVLNEAVTSHNGNASLLVLGPPGTGKTLVVERALQEVCARHNGPHPVTTAPAATSTAAAATAGADAAAMAAVRNVGVVRLNGLLQPDERTAFQEVARQLCRDFGQKFVKSATFDENLVFLKGMLHALYKCIKKVVFVVDEFQQYAKRGKQQMLYYLLDMLQDSKIQAAVIGISSAHNVAEDLEKRVLSRVGRRRILVTFPAPAQDDLGVGPAASNSPGGSAARSPVVGASGGGGSGSRSTGAGSSDGGADSYEGLLYDMLALHPGMADLAGLGESAAAGHNAAVAAALREGPVAAALEKMALFGAPPQHVALVAETALSAWGDDLCRQGTAAASGAPAQLTAGHLLAGLQPVVESPERALVDVVSGLPVLSLVLLVAAHRLLRKGQAMCNFEMVWDEYRSIQGQRGAINFCKPAAAAAWQALPLSGLAHYVDSNIESRGRDLSYAGVVMLLGAADLDRGIREHPHCPDAVTRFHMQEI